MLQSAADGDAGSSLQPDRRLRQVSAGQACQAVLFDLDGTLIDSAPDLIVAVAGMLECLGRAVPPARRIEAYVGKGIPRLVHRALTADMQADAEPALHAHALGLFEGLYRRQSGRASKLSPGVTASLDRLRQARLPLACVTNKSRAFTLPLLEQFDLARHFDVVVAGDDALARKPDPAPVRLALDGLQASQPTALITPSRVVMIGDSANDVRAARAAGCAAWCVPYGYREGETIAALGADRVVDDIAHAARLILGLEAFQR
jgi:phosphoglycolate phosphatase